MDTMTADMKKKVVSVVENAEASIQKGEDAVSAFAKAASAANLPPEFIKRAVEAGNVRRSISFVSSREGEDRAGSFPVVNPEEVVDRVYAGAEKVAKFAKPAAEVFGALDGLFTKEYDPQQTVKAASLTRETEKSPSMDHLLKQAFIHLGQLEKEEAALRSGAAAARTMVHEQFEKLASRVRQNLGAFAEAERNAKGVLGEVVAPVFDGVAERMSDIGIKVARYTGPITKRVVARGSVADDACGVITLAKQAAVFDMTADKVSNIRDGFSFFVADQTVKAAGAVQDILESRLGDFIGLEEAKVPETDNYADVSTTARAEQDGIKSQLTMMRLLQDPVLRRNPAKAVDAFNTLAASFPAIAQNEMTAAPYVRKALESGGPEMMDLTSAAQVQKAMRGGKMEEKL